MSNPSQEPLAPRFAAMLAEFRAASPDHPRRTGEAMLLASLVLILEALLSLISAWEAGQPLPAIPRRLRAPHLHNRRHPRSTRLRGAQTRAQNQTHPSSARTRLRAPHPHARSRAITLPPRHHPPWPPPFADPAPNPRQNRAPARRRTQLPKMRLCAYS